MSSTTLVKSMYIVGGTVRDLLLGLDPSDTDMVAVGFTPQELLDRGFTQIGKDFPVFLDPETGNEVALARTDRKMSAGYNGFYVDVAGITLEQDLLRRDISINSMAMLEDGTIIDPYGGQDDLKNGVLRHTSEAFVEDPVRVLRLARFRAKLPHFRIHPSTKVLVYSMRNELTSLQPDRVYKEIEKVLKQNNSRVFFETLLELNVLDVLFPNVYALVTCKEGTKHHREASVFEHTMMCLDELEKQEVIDVTHVVSCKLALLYHDIAKPSCIKEVGNSAGHDSLELISTKYDIQIPTGTKAFVNLFTSQHIRAWRLHEMTPQKVLKFYKLFQGHKKVLSDFIAVCNADSLGRTTDYKRDVLNVNNFLELQQRLKDFTPKYWILSFDERPSNQRIKDYVHKQELNIVKQFYNEVSNRS